MRNKPTDITIRELKNITDWILYICMGMNEKSHPFEFTRQSTNSLVG